MSRDLPRLLAILCVLAILGSLALHLVSGTACLRAPATRPTSGCQQDITSESQAQASPCSLFCCTGMPGTLKISIPPVLSLAFALPGIQGLSTCQAPSPPPPRSLLFIHP